MKFQLEILLSTYNGERYLSEQIDSLLSQTFTNWRLLVRDDGSQDGTCDIINRYVELYPGKIILLDDKLGRLGPSQSFAMLISQSVASYVAFCDQDDVWCSDKLTKQMNKIFDEESAREPHFPLLINTDLKVADQALNVMSPSYWKYQNLNPEKMCDLRHLLVQNHITGCTFLMNRALVNNVLYISEKAVMHDWWVALVAAAKGAIISIDDATVLYRQHGENEIGAKKWSFTRIVKDVLSGTKKTRSSFSKTRLQAKALLESGLIHGDSKMIIKKYVDMFDMGWFGRRKVLLKEGFSKQGFVRNSAMFFYL